MTEYDYSPDAYERFLARQREVRGWSEGVSACAQVDPLNTPPTPLPGPAALPRSKSSSKHRARSTERDRDRDRDKSESRRHRRSPPPPLPLDRGPVPVQRPRTAPPRGDVYGLQQPMPLPPSAGAQFYPQGYYPPAPGYFPAQPYPAQPPLPPQGHNRSRSTSQAPPPPPKATRTRSYSFAQAPPPNGARSNSYPYTAAQAAAGVGTKGYVYHPGYVTAPPQQYGGGGGGGGGGPYGGAHPALFNQPQTQQPRSPTKEVPLLKRVFGFGGGKRESRSTSREGGRRSSSRQDSY
ncbi:hypothetical protein C8R47DRAFT_323186 [Mycena vitilis]|nr:hypothetical protein C8R47DRAFT_323186 [Mycena vitilis]